MKKIILFIAALAVTCSCSETEPEIPGNGGGYGESDIPQVVFSDVTASSFTASWNPVEGAGSYRYEVTRLTDTGKELIALEGDYKETSFTLTALQPASVYSVRVASRMQGVTSTRWFEGEVTTTGSELDLTITPVEKYVGGYVYPAASVVSSDEGVYYWVSAVPTDNADNALAWIQEDVDYSFGNYGSWDALVEAGLIMNGSGTSVGFNFNGYGDFLFVAAPVSSTASGISVSSRLYFSREFFASGLSSTVYYPAEKSDYLGEWMLTTSGTLVTSDGYYASDPGEIFPVTITSASDGGVLELTGWGGDRNAYAGYPLKLDYEEEDQGYGRFSISLPQKMTTDDDGVTWSYYAWCTFYGGSSADIGYFPFEESYADEIPLTVAFRGSFGNMNKTMIKVFGSQFTDNIGTGFLITALWPYGKTSDDEGVYLNGTHGEPMETYYLVRKDVADGAVLEIPESETAETSLSGAAASSGSDIAPANEAKTVIEAYSRMTAASF